MEGDISTMAETMEFNFNSFGNLSIPIDDGIILCLQQTGHSIACLYLTDAENNRIPIPEGFSVSSPDPNDHNVYATLDPIQNIYALVYSEDYEIYYRNKNILSLMSQKAWIIVNR
jgi:hypothetical protein